MASITTRVKGFLAAALLLLACGRSHYAGGGRQNELPVDQRNSTAGTGELPSIDLEAGGEPSNGGSPGTETSGNGGLGGSSTMAGNAGVGGSATTGGSAGSAGTSGATGGGGTNG